MEDSGADLQALLGFSSFGRPRKRVRHSHKFSNRESPEASSRSETASRGELHDVVPETEIQLSQEDGSLASALQISPRGVALLTKVGGRINPERLKALLQGDEAEAAQEPRTEEVTKAWALPFSSMELLAELAATKARFGELDPRAFALARRRGNPYEAIGRHRFINRSAMKMANLDFVFQWTQQHRVRRTDADPFVFADVCGGPGGFSEYLLWRMGSPEAQSEMHDGSESTAGAAGFGISLRGTTSCDWKVRADKNEEDTSSDPTFQVCYGADGTGDLYKIENIRSFRDELRSAYPEGAHLVVADGGFQDARNQNNQELMMTRLVVAETLTMFSVLRVGGSFLCKTFELSSPLMLQLMWLIHQCFEEFTIVKPVTSRPASSERYVVAQKLHADLPLDAIRSRLALLVKELKEESASPLLLRARSDMDAAHFLAFMAHASDRHTRQQITACKKIMASATGDADEEGGLDRWHYYRRWSL